jgi:hypothetical protein
MQWKDLLLAWDHWIPNKKRLSAGILMISTCLEMTYVMKYIFFSVQEFFNGKQEFIFWLQLEQIVQIYIFSKRLSIPVIPEKVKFSWEACQIRY